MDKHVVIISHARCQSRVTIPLALAKYTGLSAAEFVQLRPCDDGKSIIISPWRWPNGKEKGS